LTSSLSPQYGTARIAGPRPSKSDSPYEFTEEPARLSAITDQEELASEVVRLGEGFSLPVTPEEVRACLASGQKCELSDDELEMVIGGNDSLDGSSGNDTLDGGDGNDIINGGIGNDQVWACAQKG